MFLWDTINFPMVPLSEGTWQKIELIAKKERKKKQETKQNPEKQHAEQIQEATSEGGNFLSTFPETQCRSF